MPRSNPSGHTRLLLVLLASLAPPACTERHALPRRPLLRAAVAAAAATGAASIGELHVAHAASADGGEDTISDAVLLDTRSGRFLPASPQRYLADAIAASRDGTPRVFFAGEEHTHRLHHAFQLELIKAVDALDDAPTWIGLEMCWRQHQPALDAFVFADEARGGGSIETLAQRTQWARTWGYPIGLYEEVLALARERRLRLCGLNAPYPVVQAVAKVGLEGLRPELRNMLPDVDVGNEEHRRRFVEALGGSVGSDGVMLPPEDEGMHGAMTAASLQRTYEAMALWDDFMASSIAGYVSAEPKAGAGLYGGRSTGTERMVVLAGSSHIAGRVGMPDRFAKRAQLPSFTVLPLSVPWPEAGKPAIASPLPTSEADWVLYTRPQGVQAPNGLSLASSRRFASRAIYI